jgi:aspartyl/asparaginyl-tRNA synthetase
MNTYKNLTNENFRRLTGIKRTTFEKMIEILKEKEAEKNKRGARPNKIPLEERLLMWLEYMREYGTYFHIATKHKVSESTCFRNCVWIEDILIKSKEFKLPNKKEFVNNLDIEVVVVDASESPIEKPKKSKENTTRGRKRGIPSRLK